MIARVEVRLRRDALAARVRETVRRAATDRAMRALAEADAATGPPDEKLTTRTRADGLSRDV
ncbi:hypothetical protein [Aureimonas flava]|uniref:hypothetical protein n=1 Tax=Aureimonas flava TaxID=2320271 RepID=UPI001459FFC6|nr:hypothetical protein [Aureimonas flava]